MRTSIFFLLAFFFSTQNLCAGDLRKIRCDFVVYGAPFVTLDFSYSEEGSLSEYANVTHYGRTTQETLTKEAAAPEILIHAILSKESAENWISLFVAPDLNAKLINSHVPNGFQEILGTCQHP